MSLVHMVTVSMLMIGGFSVLAWVLGLSGWAFELMLLVAVAAGALSILSEVWSGGLGSKKSRRRTK